MKNFLINIYIKFLTKKLDAQLKSQYLRNYYQEKFDLQIGEYSYGCFDPSRIGRGTIIGRYCSFAPTVYIFTRNHGISSISTHPYLYNSNLGFIEKDTILSSPCVIEDDVWLGHNAVLTASVNKIGRGAIIGAGAIVTKDVPAYAIMAGNPARIVRYRFSPEIIEKIESSQWWLLSDTELHNLIKKSPDFIYRPIDFFSEKNSRG